ncbi:MAG TPA: hypothetical protein VGJ00_04770 [Rhabdochlamydiaceae bacterium]|jgi:hypothetical protein
MSASPLRLDYPLSLNATEFWYSQPILHSNMQKMMGDRLLKSPILEFQDILTRSCCGYNFPKKINSQIVVAVDDFTKIKEIAILYRVRVVEKPKCCWLPILKWNEVRILIFSKEEFPSLFLDSSPLFNQAFSRKDTDKMWCHESNQYKQFQEAQLLFKDDFYYAKSCSCFALYQPAKVSIY